jgi:hypothetical protein
MISCDATRGRKERDRERDIERREERERAMRRDRETAREGERERKCVCERESERERTSSCIAASFLMISCDAGSDMSRRYLVEG